eukprot:6098512-Pleurochrysis_carterae.AAC.2
MLTYPHAPARDVWPAPPVLPSGPRTALRPGSPHPENASGGWREGRTSRLLARRPAGDAIVRARRARECEAT